MLSPIPERILTESLSAIEYFISYQDDKEKKAEISNQIKSDSIEISDAGREALNASQINQNTSYANKSNRTEETKSYTMKSANTTFSESAKIKATDAFISESTLKSGGKVNIYMGDSDEFKAEITQKDGSTEVITLTENTIISEDASGRVIVKEVPRTMQNTGTNPNGTKSAQYEPSHLQGTDGDDIIINLFEGTNSINTGKGNDTVISLHSVNNIDLGDGNNKLHALGGHYQSITAGDGANTIDSKTSNSMVESISLGHGNNNVNTSSVRNLLMGDGNNSVDVQSVLGGLKVGDGDSELNIHTMHKNSQLNLGLGSNNVDVTEMREQSSINNTAGNQNISILRMQDAVLNLKEGNHKVNVYESEGSNIYAGDGDSRYYVEQMHNSNLSVGEGNNEFHVKYLHESTINMKKEEETAKITKKSNQDGQNGEASQRSSNKLYIGDMKNSQINGGSGDTNFYVNSMDESTINSGDGNDAFYFDELGGGTINTGAGDDIMYVKGSIWGHENSSPLNLDMGEGNNKLDVQGHVHKLNFTSGSGNDSVKIGSFINDSNIDTGYGEDEVNRNLNSFVHNSNIRYGLTEEEQIKTHEISRSRDSIINADMMFAKINPEDKKILDETLKKSPFYEAPFSLQTGHTKKETPFYDTALERLI